MGLVGYSLKKYGILDKIAPSAKVQESTVPKRVDLPALNPSLASNVAAVPAPGSTPGCTDKPEVRMLVWAWNAQMGLMFATGGPQATTGSLMCKEGVNLRLVRQDDSGKMQEALVAFATELKSGVANPTKGAHFVAIMGDGSAAFLKGLNDSQRLGRTIARIVGSARFPRRRQASGRPNGRHPRGLAASGGRRLRDGDWNIARKVGDNPLQQPGGRPLTPRAEWVNASITGRTGKIRRELLRGAASVGRQRRPGTKRSASMGRTWTPGDVNVAQKRGGLVSVFDEGTSQSRTRDHRNRQMDEGQPPTVEACSRRSSTVRSSEVGPGALHRRAVSSNVYNEKKPTPLTGRSISSAHRAR